MNDPCFCVDVNIGDHSHGVALINPSGVRNGGMVSVDVCIATEIAELWHQGVKTTNSCCGHGRLAAWVMVTEDSYDKMAELGYTETRLSHCDEPVYTLGRRLTYRPTKALCRCHPKCGCFDGRCECVTRLLEIVADLSARNDALHAAAEPPASPAPVTQLQNQTGLDGDLKLPAPVTVRAGDLTAEHKGREFSFLHDGHIVTAKFKRITSAGRAQFTIFGGVYSVDPDTPVTLLPEGGDNRG